jgi:hypothetical protein
LILARDRDHATRRQERVIAEAGGWALQEGAARDGEAPDREASIVLAETGCRASRRVIAAMPFALENDYRGEGRELAGRSGTCDTSADDHDVRGIGGSGTQLGRARGNEVRESLGRIGTRRMLNRVFL